MAIARYFERMGRMQMKTGQFTKRIGGAILGLVMVLGVGFTFSTSAQAQYQDDRYSQERNRRLERERLERERLERERLEQQRIWNQQNGTWNQNQNQNNGDWQRNQNGQWGRNRGRRGGRNGDGYGNYGGSFQLRQTALNAGYNEGIKEGRTDRRRGEGYEFRDENAFQKASKDYSSRLGDRNLYSRYFREAFQNGYDAGYNGY
jgi:hypothetical protein